MRRVVLLRCHSSLVPIMKRAKDLVFRPSSNFQNSTAPSKKQLAEGFTCMFASEIKEQSHSIHFMHSIKRNCVFVLIQDLNLGVEEALPLVLWLQDRVEMKNQPLCLCSYCSLCPWKSPCPVYQENSYPFFGTRQNDHLYYEVSLDILDRVKSFCFYFCLSPTRLWALQGSGKCFIDVCVWAQCLTHS